jgi:nucleotide-binding universal stress UspA family protein
MTSEARSIVVATDFSPTAGLALARACELAKERGDRIVLAHAVSIEPVPMAGPELLVLPVDYESKIHEASETALQKLVDETKQKGVEVTGALAVGPPVDVVLQAVEEHDAALIVIGTRGMSGFKHLLLGSVAEAVVRRSKVPVLTVHPSDERPLSKIGHVIVPTDFSDEAAHVIEHLVDVLPSEQRPKLTLLHVYQLPVIVAPLVGLAPEMPTLAEDARAEAHKALDPLAEVLRGQGFEVEVIGREGDPATVISDLTEQPGADLVVMSTRGLSKLEQILLGSTAERVVQHARCPVLTLRRS